MSNPAYTKTVLCVKCQTSVLVGRSISAQSFICTECRSVYPTKRQDHLQNITKGDQLTIRLVTQQIYHKKSPNLTKLGFNFDGDPIVETHKLKALLVQEYEINGDSMPVIMKRYGIPSAKTLNSIFNLLGINTRSLSDARTNAIVMGRSDSHFKGGRQSWHETWDGRRVFLRSSNELRLAQRFDREQVIYEVETKRIPYFDTQLDKMRIAVVDFFIPSTNTLIEVKSQYFFDEINIRDRAKAIHAAGYTFILCLDDVSYRVDPLSNDLRKHG